MPSSWFSTATSNKCTLQLRGRAPEKGALIIFAMLIVDALLTTQRLIFPTMCLSNKGTSINHPEKVILPITRYKPKALCRETQTSEDCIQKGCDTHTEFIVPTIIVLCEFFFVFLQFDLNEEKWPINIAIAVV